MASVIFQQFVLQIQTIMKHVFCNRRQQKPTIDGWKVKNPSFSKPGMEPCADSADASTDDVSDQSGHQSSTGSDSEADAPSQDHISLPQQASLTSFAKLAPPPGLGTVPEQKRKDPPWSRTRTTADLVESQLRARKEAASSIKAAHNVPDNLLALKSALDKLDANEIATVKSLLDFKMRDASRPLAASDSPAAHRPLATLLGTRAPQQTFRPRERQEPPRIDPEERERRQTQIQEVESTGMTLRTHLRDLSAVENGRVLTLRKISKLGLNSPELLEEYFTKKFGEVERMMVTHTISKAPKTQEKTRLRPAPLGFVLMKTVEDAHAALHYKEAHVVNGVEISVLPFNSHPVDETG